MRGARDEDDDARAMAAPLTRDDAMRVLGLDERDARNPSLVKRTVRERALDAHPDRATGSRERFSAVMASRDILLSDLRGGGTNRGFTMAESAARRATDNALPKHFKSFIVATALVLVGVSCVRTNAGERRKARSPLVRDAMGLPPSDA
jgi:hypothetical protein